MECHDVRNIPIGLQEYKPGSYKPKVRMDDIILGIDTEQFIEVAGEGQGENRITIDRRAPSHLFLESLLERVRSSEKPFLVHHVGGPYLDPMRVRIDRLFS